MVRRLDVGRSSRTPVKHEILHSMLGKVCGVLSADSDKVPCKATWANPLVCVDLCGGDGLRSDDHDCSPMIMFDHCSKLAEKGKRSKLKVIEKMDNTFEQLTINCGHLSKEIVTLTRGDARDYRLPQLGHNQPAFVHCDPNSVDQIPLTKPFVQGFNRFTTYLVTLGCNVGGQKMLPFSKRELWFEYVTLLTDVLPSHHDDILFWLNSDSAQWAYLLSIPKVWSDDFAAKMIKKTAEMWTHGLSAASYRRERKRFDNELKRLFLTKEEYERQ